MATSDRRNQHPRVLLAPILAEATPEEIFLRVESQHFCKLPTTGAIAFGIRIVSFPLPEVLARPDFRPALREQLRTMPATVTAYKGIPAQWWKRL